MEVHNWMQLIEDMGELAFLAFFVWLVFGRD